MALQALDSCYDSVNSDLQPAIVKMALFLDAFGVLKCRGAENKGEETTVTYTITDACIGTKDRSCVDVCPVDCIHDDGDDDKMLYIDPDECIDCGACEPACPVTAIFAEDDVPDNMKPYTQINALWYKDKAAARAQVDALHP